MKIIHTTKAPKAIGPYSQAIYVGNTLYLSGQLPINPKTGETPKTVGEQTLKALENLQAIVLEAGLKVTDIVKCTVLMKDLHFFSEMNDVYAAFFGAHKPTRVAYEVARLPKDVLVEIDAIAVKTTE